MQVELNSNEVTMIEQALECWEREATGNALFGGMLGLMCSGKEERANEKSKIEREMDKAKLEGENRKRRAILLRAKLIQASAVNSEHEFDAKEVPSGNP